MTQINFPEAKARVQAAIDADIFRRGNWGDGVETVCAMSAMVPGAHSTEDCVTAGWPEWLVVLVVWCFDEDVGADDEDAAAEQFALDVATAVSVQRDLDKARDLFLIARIDTGEFSAIKSLRALDGDFSEEIDVCKDVVALLRRRLNGEDVAAGLAAGLAAAWSAAWSAWAADAAWASQDASWADADAEDASWATAWAADTADTADGALAAARADLIDALNQA